MEDDMLIISNCQDLYIKLLDNIKDFQDFDELPIYKYQPVSSLSMNDIIIRKEIIDKLWEIYSSIREKIVDLSKEVYNIQNKILDNENISEIIRQSQERPYGMIENKWRLKLIEKLINTNENFRESLSVIEINEFNTINDKLKNTDYKLNDCEEEFIDDLLEKSME